MTQGGLSQGAFVANAKSINWFTGILLIALIALLPFVAVYFAIKSQYKVTTVAINQVEIKAQIATTSQQKERGLCCRDSLPQNFGMLFVYDRPGDYQFWMKNTRIPLDIFWVNEHKQITHIEQRVEPRSYPKTFGSPKLSKYVLETNAGIAEKYKIKVGDSVRF